MNKLLLIFLTCTFLYSDIKIYAPSTFTTNEPYDFVIEASGESVNLAKISQVDDMVIQILGTSSTLSIINLKQTKSIKRTFRIYPTKDFILPSFDVEVDGKSFYTKEVEVKQVKSQQTKSDEFILQMDIDKKDVYVGEAINLTLTFGYKKDLDIVDLSMENPRFQDFWMSKSNKNEKYENDGFVYQKMNFLLYPQKSGNLNISPVKVNVALLDTTSQNYSFFTRTAKNKTIISNEINIDVKPLPQDIILVGKFNIESYVDKIKLNSNEALSYKIKIEGEGNINDLNPIKLDIQNVNIYSNDPKIVYDENDTNKFTYEQTFSIVANNDYIIKPIELKYFNLEEQKVITLKTDEFDIDIKDEQKQEAKNIEVNTDIKNTPTNFKANSEQSYVKYIFLVCGIVIGILASFMLKRNFINKSNDKNDSPLEKKIKKADDSQTLLKILAPFIRYDKSLDKILYELESNKNIDVKIKKKEIIKIVKSLNLKGM